MSSGNLDLDLRSAAQVRGNEILRDFDRLREADPVFWSVQSQCWILSRHEDVAALFMNRLPVRHGGRIEASSFAGLSDTERTARIPTLSKYVPGWVINVDGEEHRRIRGLLMKAFSRAIVEGVRGYARERAGLLVDMALSRSVVEFNEEIARPLTGSVLFKLIGLPESKFLLLKDWATAFVEGLGSGGSSLELLERAEWAAREMNHAVLSELEKRKVEPREDLITSMLHASESGQALSVDEILAQMQIIIIAGHDTTANTMTLGVEALQRNREAWKYMHEHPEELERSVAELQRYVAMSAGQALVAAEDFTLHGKQIKRGEVVVGLIAAADRDPLVFSDPAELDLKRKNSSRSLVFAPGPHFCLGHLLAKMQLSEFFRILISRCDVVEVLDQGLNFMPVLTFRGLYNLNVRFHPRRSA